MRTVLILNHHSMQNAGDAALLEVTVRQMRAWDREMRIGVVSNSPEESALARLGVEALPSPEAISRGKGRLSDLLAGIRRADLAIGCPGNPFFSMGRFGKPLLLSAVQLWLAIRADKPLVILPQTIGPFTRAWEASFVRALYRRARRVYLRDAISLRLASSWRLNAIYAPDPSFLFPPAPPQEAREALFKAGWDGRPALGVSVIPRMVRTLAPSHLENAYLALADGLKRIEKDRGVMSIFFAQSTGPTAREDDREPAHRVLAIMGSSVARLVESPLSPALLKACYGQMQAFAAGRLHAGLFAFSMGVPTLFTGYLTKTQGLLESLGLSAWGIQLEEVSVEGYHNRLTRLLQSAPPDPARLSAWQAAVEQPYQWIRENL